MMLGVSLKIDVTKIDKSRLFKGQKGIYLDATVFIDIDNPDQYGNNGMITQSVSQEEREAGTKGAILGNSKVFLKKGGEQAAPQAQAAPKQPAPVKHESTKSEQPPVDAKKEAIEPPPMPKFDGESEDDIPF